LTVFEKDPMGLILEKSQNTAIICEEWFATSPFLIGFMGVMVTVHASCAQCMGRSNLTLPSWRGTKGGGRGRGQVMTDDWM
jgi:tricorn protease-like protein